MKKGLSFVVFFVFCWHLQVSGQQSVSIGTTNTNPSAVLWLNSPGQNQALIIPVVSSVNAVPSPVAGMVVYDQSANAMFYRNGTAWVQLGGAVTLTAGAGIGIAGNTITNTGDTNSADDITTSTTAAGDLTGTYPAPTVARLRGVGVAATAPATNQVLQYNGTNWTPATLPTGLTNPMNAAGDVIYGGASGTPTRLGTGSGFLKGGATPAWSAINLASTDVTGTLPRASGGTGVATTPSNGQLLIGNGTGYALSTLTAGTGVTITNGAGTISISSTGLTNPMTATGDLIVGGASGTAARLGIGSGFLKGGTTPGWSAVNLASTDVTGTLPRASGGTGVATTPTNGQLLIGNGAGYALSTLTAGAGVNITNGAGTISISSTGLINPMTAVGDLIVGGAGGAATRLGGTAGFLKSTGAATPAWSAVNLAGTDVSGTLPLANGGTGATTATAARTNLGLGALAPLNAVSTTEITDGTIVNADVSTTAAIAGTKISPNFGAQAIATTGSVSTATLNATGAVTLGSLAGSGSRMVVADAAGALGTQAIPTTFSTVNVVPKGDGTTLVASSIFDNGNVGIGTTAPYNKFSIVGANGSATGAHQSFFTTSDTNNPTLQFMNWGHNDLGIYFDSYLSTSNSWTSSSAISNFAIHKATNLDFQYEAGVAAGSGISWSNAMSIQSDGDVAHNNYTRLGSTGPYIRTVKLTGTTAAASGGSSNVTLTGIPITKILSVYVSVQYATTASVPSNYTINPTFEFQHYFYESGGSTVIVVWNKSGNDSSLLNKPFTVYVTYEQ